MADPFIAEIRMMSFGFPPKNWATCDGQILAINQNQALFALLGTTFGGNGQTTFALPNLQGCTPIHVGQSHTLGERAGEQAHLLSIAELPAHVHNFNATTANASSPAPGGNLLATASNLYTGPTNLTSLNPGTISSAGGSQPHLNMQPFLTISFCIALVGIFPSRN